MLTGVYSQRSGVSHITHVQHDRVNQAMKETSKKPSVLLLGPSINAVGGGPTHIRHLLRSPLATVYDLIHFEVGSRGRESPSSDEPLVIRTIRVALSPLRLAWAVACRAPAILHVNASLNSRSFWRDAVYVIVGKMLGRKIVYQIHGGSVEQFCNSRPLMRAFCRQLFRLTDYVVVISAVQFDRFARLFESNRVTLIPNAIDLTEFARERKPDLQATRPHGLHLLFLARLVRDKGIFELIEAMSALREDAVLSGLTLTIAGSGPAYQEVVQRTAALGLNGRVRIVGSVQGEAKAKLLREADIFILPSYHEGLPYALLESLACGIPVIATRVGGIPDVVQQGIHGVLIEPRNVEEIVRAIRLLACDTSLLERMSDHCVVQAREQYGLDRLSRQFDALYRTLIESTEKRPVTT